MFQELLAARLAEMASAPDYPRLVTEVLGIRGASAELARRLVTQALVVGDRHEAWRRVGERVCPTAPASPGVYVFRDSEGCALYVGKAVNVRRRLHAHFAGRRWLKLKPALARVASVDWREVGSEIEGLMHEATLIRELQPTVNVHIGTPAFRTRAIPRAVLRDVVLVVPSIDPHSAELVAARTDGRSLRQRVRRSGADLTPHVERLWQFFQTCSGDDPNPDEASLAPLIFSWLAGRGSGTTRVDPHDTASSAALRARLAALLQDNQLFHERLVLARGH